MYTCRIITANIFLYIALRTLRTLRSISFIRGLQVLVNALIQTFKSSVFYLLLLLMILMFLFAIIGYYFFGYEDDGDKRNWGTFGQCLLSLFIFVTVSTHFIQNRTNSLILNKALFLILIFIIFISNYK